MSIQVKCKDCSMTHQVKDEAAGKRITCRGCGRKLLVKGPVHFESNSAKSASDDLARGEGQSFERKLPATLGLAAPVEPLPPFGKRLFGFVVSVLLLGLVGYFSTVVAGSFGEAWRSSSWPSVMGAVKSSNVQRTGVGKNARTVVVVMYDYEVGNVRHKGHRVCVEGYSKKIFESAQAVSARYVAEQPVKVFYDPTNPASAVLVTGTTPSLWWPVIMLALLGSSVGYAAYASFRSLIGKPLPKRAQTGRSFVERAMGLFVAGMIALLVGTMIFGIAFSTRQNWHVPRDVGEWFMLFFILFLLAILLSMAWFICFAVYCQFKPAAKASDLRAEPGGPSYSADSLICLSGYPGRITAIIVDDQAGLIHFRRSFWPVGFWVIKAVPWFSCPLKKITSVQQQTFKGTTRLTIRTDAGKAYTTSQASGFDELQRRFNQCGST